MTSEPVLEENAWPAPQDAESAQAFYVRLSHTLNELMATLDEEATLIRSAKLRDAAAIGTKKAMLAEDYRRALTVLRANAAMFGREAPREVEELKLRHGEFERILQTNLAVLATARTVAETLVRSVATYGSNAKRPELSARAGAIAVDVAL